MLKLGKPAHSTRRDQRAVRYALLQLDPKPRFEGPAVTGDRPAQKQNEQSENQG